MEIEQAKGELTAIAVQYYEELAVITASLVRLTGLKERFINLHDGEVPTSGPARSVLNFAETVIGQDYGISGAVDGVKHTAELVEYYRDRL